LGCRATESRQEPPGRTLGQWFNLAGVAAVAAVAASEPRLSLRHVSVQDIRWLEWAELHRADFLGVVFDKDNTLTVPYAPTIWPPRSTSVARHSSPARSPSTTTPQV
jgi:hypothetical protein